MLQKEEVEQVLEQTCKDFLQEVVKYKAYNINMKSLNITKLESYSS